MNKERFKNVEIGLNYSTTETDATDVIYLLEGEDGNTNAIFSITLDEAEWLSKKLIDYVNKFEQANMSKKDSSLDENFNVKLKVNAGKEFPFLPIDFDDDEGK
jgi:hypothetical protein